MRSWLDICQDKGFQGKISEFDALVHRRGQKKGERKKSRISSVYFIGIGEMH